MARRKRRGLKIFGMSVTTFAILMVVAGFFLEPVKKIMVKIPFLGDLYKGSTPTTTSTTTDAQA